MTAGFARLCLIVLAAAALTAPSAWAKGTPPEKLPLPTASVGAANGGVPTGTGGQRYIARSNGGRTVVTRIAGAGRTLDATRLRGAFVIPAVTLDGTPGGLSADGSTLVLIQRGPASSRSQTTLAILDARRLQPRRVAHLRGDFSFDAISPDGSRLFLIDYRSPADPTKYSVRAYDARAGHLVAKPIVDPNEGNSSDMGGYPADRVMSPDARWAYTLYSAPGRKPFVHALDTIAGRAVCVDLPQAGMLDLREGHLNLGGGGTQLTVADRRGRAVAVVNTKTLEASAPGIPIHEAATPTARGGSGPSWELVAMGGLVALLAAGGLGLSVRRRRRAMAATG